MDYSLYIHIPFCKRRCHYCDFNTYVGMNAFMEAYIDAVINELRIVNKANHDIQLQSIYFGGGTPSLIPDDLYSKLLKEIDLLFSMHLDCEISIEANPCNLSLEYSQALRAMGFNRISIGVQSFDPFDLLRLGRIHKIWDVFNAFRNVRKAGFLNINLDLIFGLPWQNLQGWKTSLSRAIKLTPEHFSIYSLIIEPGTPLYGWYEKGLIKKLDQDLEADMYELTIEMLNYAGYEHYEISNWAKNNLNYDYRCRHNLQYWLGLPYLGIGAGAHGFADGYRTVNTPLITDYIHRCNLVQNGLLLFPRTPSQISMQKIDEKTQMMDFMMVGLRLVKEGVSEDRFNELFGKSMKEEFGQEIDRLIEVGLLEWGGAQKKKLHLTTRGIMIANQVFMAFV